MSDVIDLSTVSNVQGFQLTGAGTSVSNAGDVNGDGIDDVIVGAHGANTTGEAYVVYGKTGGTTTINLASLAVGDGYRILGAENFARTGSSVSNGGDINGDGIADIIIGAPNASIGGNGAGAVYVVYGEAGTARATVNLNVLPLSKGFLITGSLQHGALGGSVSGGSDVNSDGIGDIVVGAPGIDGTYVIYGESGTAHESVSVGNLASTQGYAINGAFGFGGGDDVGASVATGDINNDGIADIIIGAPRANHGGNPPPVSGDVYVIYGAAGTGRTLIDATAVTPSDGFVLQIDDLDPNLVGSAGDSLGSGVASAGDVNGDGIGDIIISAAGNDDGGDTAGKAFVVYGQSGATRGRLNVFNISPSNGFAIQGDTDFDGVGAVSAAGDLNGDGFADIIVGARLGDDGGTNAGEAYVIYGQSGASRGLVDLTGLSSSDGFIIRGDSTGHLAGHAVSGGGDINGDGIDDIVIAAVGSGSAYIIYGGAPFSTLLNPVLGTPGIDTLFNLATDDEINGLASVDTLDMSSFTSAITLNTVTGTITSAQGGNDIVLSVEEFNLGSGDDVVTLGNSGFVIRGNDGNDVVTGGTGLDRIFGGGGNDVIAGGSGAANQLNGGNGDDLYIVSVAADMIIEAANQGTDTIETTLMLFTNRANVETLRFTDGAAHTGIGIAQNETLIGSTGADGLFGRGGDDILMGGTGAANTLVGGLGNDIFIVGTAGDSIVEVAGEGIDEIQTSVATITNRANVETLRFTDGTAHTGIGIAQSETLIGNTGADGLFGRAGDDVLRGGTGAANTLVGGLDNDTYYSDAVGDSIVEAVGEGIDSVITNLSSHTLKINVENLNGGSGGAFTGIGNAIGNAITGGNFDDFLSGLDGDDVLTGGSGIDFLIGGNGADTFRMSGSDASVDRVFDFVSGVDKIALSGSVYTHTATIDYVAGAAATSTNSTFLYTSGNGILSYDADGTGSGAAVAIANMGGGLTLAVGDFLFY